MANVFDGHRAVIDTFTSAVSLITLSGFPGPFKLNFIEWQTPTTVGHTAAVTEGVGGTSLLSETAVTANESVTKVFDGAWVKDVNIAQSGVGSGKIIIDLH